MPFLLNLHNRISHVERGTAGKKKGVSGQLSALSQVRDSNESQGSAKLSVKVIQL